LWQIFAYTGTGTLAGTPKIRELYPQWWGALGDGANDDVEEIQMALDMANTMGGAIVFFPIGTYNISSALTMYTEVTLQGAGAKATFIYVTAVETNGIELPSNGRWMNIKDMTIGTAVAEVSGAGILFNLTNGGANNRVENVNIDNFAYGVKAGEVFWENAFYNVRVNCCAESGFYVAGTAGGNISLLFEKCYVESSSNYDMYFHNITQSIILNCNFGGSEVFRNSSIDLNGNTVSILNPNFEGHNFNNNEGAIDIWGGSNFITGAVFRGLEGAGGGNSYCIRNAGGVGTVICASYETSPGANMKAIQVSNDGEIYNMGNLWVSDHNDVLGAIKNVVTDETECTDLEGDNLSITDGVLNVSGLPVYTEGTWTAVIRGSGTAGTYEITSQNSNYTRIGRVVHLESQITLAGSITGGGDGNLQITGCPFTKMASSSPVGSVITQGVDFTGTQLNVTFITGSATSTLCILETVDNAAFVALPITAIAANDKIYFSITFFV